MFHRASIFNPQKNSSNTRNNRKVKCMKFIVFVGEILLLKFCCRTEENILFSLGSQDVDVVRTLLYTFTIWNNNVNSQTFTIAFFSCFSFVSASVEGSSAHPRRIFYLNFLGFLLTRPFFCVFSFFLFVCPALYSSRTETITIRSTQDGIDWIESHFLENPLKTTSLWSSRKCFLSFSIYI